MTSLMWRNEPGNDAGPRQTGQDFEEGPAKSRDTSSHDSQPEERRRRDEGDESGTGQARGDPGSADAETSGDASVAMEATRPTAADSAPSKAY